VASKWRARRLINERERPGCCRAGIGCCLLAIGLFNFHKGSKKAGAGGGETAAQATREMKPLLAAAGVYTAPL
jgi:hypothetical protein